MKISSLLVLGFIAASAHAELRLEPLGSWTRMQCESSAASPQFIDIRRESAKRLTVSTNETQFLLYNLECAQVSDAEPFFRCYSYDGNESRRFYSFKRIETGFPDPYNGEAAQTVRYFFVFERDYADSSGNYKQLKRQMIYNEADCRLE